MPRKYIAFDIETAKDVPGEDFNWKPHRPLGISCAAGLCSDAGDPILWYGKTPGGDPAPRLLQADAARLLQLREKLKEEAIRYDNDIWNKYQTLFQRQGQTLCFPY